MTLWLPERRLGCEWDWLADLGSLGPSEECARAYILWGVCGHPGTQVALGDGDANPHHAERRDHAPTGPTVCMRSLTAPQSVPSADVVFSQRHPGNYPQSDTTQYVVSM